MAVPRKRILIAVLVLAVLLLAVLLALFLRPRTPSAPPSVSVPTDELPPPTFVPTEPTIIERQERDSRANSAVIQSQARLFAERYGSFSTEARHQNLTDLLPLMTDAFADRTRTDIANAASAEAFYGVTTRVVSVRTDALDEAAGTATLTVGTQRQETFADGRADVRYQNLVLTFVRTGEQWRVSSAAWD